MRNYAGRSDVLVGGVTLVSLVALLIGAGRKGRCATDARQDEDRPRSAPQENRGLSPVLERYRLAAAV